MGLFWLVCTGQEFDSWEGVAYTCDGVGLSDNCGTEGGPWMAETYPRVWNDSTSLKINNPPFACSSECSLAFFPPASASHDGDGFTLQEEYTATCAERHWAKLSATALTTQMCHFDGYTFADTANRFPVASQRPCCSVLTAPSLRPKSSTRLVARTRLLARLASGVAPLATSLLLATVLERSRVSARTRALLA